MQTEGGAIDESWFGNSKNSHLVDARPEQWNYTAYRRLENKCDCVGSDAFEECGDQYAEYAFVGIYRPRVV